MGDEYDIVVEVVSLATGRVDSLPSFSWNDNIKTFAQTKLVTVPGYTHTSLSSIFSKFCNLATKLRLLTVWCNDVMRNETTNTSSPLHTSTVLTFAHELSLYVSSVMSIIDSLHYCVNNKQPFPITVATANGGDDDVLFTYTMDKQKMAQPTLLFTMNIMLPYLHVLDTLWFVVSKLNDGTTTSAAFNSASLLTYLFEAIPICEDIEMHNNSNSYSGDVRSLRTIFDATVKPYMMMVTAWCSLGRLNDVNNELFITVIDGNHVLRRDDEIPMFLRSHAQQLLSTGETVRFAERLRPTSSAHVSTVRHRKPLDISGHVPVLMELPDIVSKDMVMHDSQSLFKQSLSVTRFQVLPTYLLPKRPYVEPVTSKFWTPVRPKISTFQWSRDFQATIIEPLIVSCRQSLRESTQTLLEHSRFLDHLSTLRTVCFGEQSDVVRSLVETWGSYLSHDEVYSYPPSPVQLLCDVYGVVEHSRTFSSSVVSSLLTSSFQGHFPSSSNDLFGLFEWIHTPSSADSAWQVPDRADPNRALDFRMRASSAAGSDAFARPLMFFRGLRFIYNLPDNLSSVVSSQALHAYGSIFVWLLELEFASQSLTREWKSSYNIHRHSILMHHLRSLMVALQLVIYERLLDPAYDEAIARIVHDEDMYLSTVSRIVTNAVEYLHDRLLLSDKAAPLRKALESIMALCVRASWVVHGLNDVDLNERNELTMFIESETAQIASELAVILRFLVPLIDRTVTGMGNYTLSDLRDRLNDVLIAVDMFIQEKE